ncbi:MAG: M23 family metallopeptidase [Deltaproteobacteria bacterium]|jgi:septal ring factor EnvC (AmiA/AmiB activator)|nr:M23 family metallopeptidase [Deltaproteobacteria bacterium]
MPFGRYHVVIFKDRGGGSRNIRMRGWLLVLSLLFGVALVACNIWLWRQYTDHTAVRDRLDEAERVIADQNNQLTGLMSKITELQSNLGRVQQFDTKLRLMMNMEGVSDEMTGSSGEEFTRSSLPLYRQELMVRRMNVFLRQLSESVKLEEVRQQELLHALRDNREMIASMPSIWPVEGFVTSRFGTRVSPLSGRRDFHKGLDISARTGTPVLAAAKGTVTFVGRDGAYGNTIHLNHGAGITTRYAHLHRFVAKEGQIVRRGTVIGYVGSTGRSTGPHLHYEVLINGVNVNPMHYILN